MCKNRRRSTINLKLAGSSTGCVEWGLVAIAEFVQFIFVDVCHSFNGGEHAQQILTPVDRLAFQFLCMVENMHNQSLLLYLLGLLRKAMVQFEGRFSRLTTQVSIIPDVVG
jgi:hypothetical protein